MKLRKRNKAPESITKPDLSTDEGLRDYVVEGIQSLVKQADRMLVGEVSLVPQTINLPYFPIHSESPAEERLEELDRNLQAYRNIVMGVTESDLYQAQHARMGDPIVRENKLKGGESVRTIYTKLTPQNVGYLVEEIHLDKFDNPLDFSAKIKLPAEDVEINDLEMNEDARPKYHDKSGQWANIKE